MLKDSYFNDGTHEAEFQTIHQCLLADHKPVGPFEVIQVRWMALNYWHLEVLRRQRDRAVDIPPLAEYLELSVARNQQRYFKLLEKLQKMQRRRLDGSVLKKRSPAS